MPYKIIIAGALATAASVLPAHAQISDDVVKIGVLTDMAGVTADITGKGSVVATEMAVEEFGSTVLGKPVQIISADHSAQGGYWRVDRPQVARRREGGRDC